MGRREIIDLNSEWVRIERDTKRKGLVKKNYRVDVKADNMLVNPDARDANREFGAALQEVIVKQVSNVRATASRATVERRQRYYRDRNSRSYRRHYAGGRIGELEPDRAGTTLLQDSGRLQYTTVRPRRNSSGESVATINFPANRLHPDYVGDFDRVMATVQAHVPILDERTTATTDKDIIAAADKITAGALATSWASMDRKLAEKRKLQLQVAKQLLKLAGGK